MSAGRPVVRDPARWANAAVATVELVIAGSLLLAGSVSWPVVPVVLLEVGQAVAALAAEPGEVVGGWLIGYAVPVATALVLLGLGAPGAPTPPPLAAVGRVLVVLGWSLSLGGLASLGRGFSVLPQRRTRVRRHGLYRFCRHPIYTGYVTSAAGALLVAWSPLRLLVVLAFLLGTALRVAAEDVALGRPLRGPLAARTVRALGLGPHVLGGGS